MAVSARYTTSLRERSSSWTVARGEAGGSSVELSLHAQEVDVDRCGGPWSPSERFVLEVPESGRLPNTDSNHDQRLQRPSIDVVDDVLIVPAGVVP